MGPFGAAPPDGPPASHRLPCRATLKGMGRQWIWFVAAAALVLAGALFSFVREAEARIAQLPALVHAELVDRGGRYVPLADISPWALQGIVATEDQTFWTNPGISLQGIVRAFLVDVETRSFAQGGSTITQQLARDQFLSDAKTVQRKLVEIAYALLITRRYPKAEILELYLNEAYFGHQAWGIEAAARTYFGLAARRLDLAQAALTVGLVQAPTDLDPLAHLAAAKARQRVVLQEMVDVGDITQAQANAAAQEPLHLVGAA